MHSPVKYYGWRPLREEPVNPEVMALWVCCLMFIAGFWIGVLLIAEKLFQ